jgi:hypothetical protein
MKVFKIALFVVLLFTGSVAISGGCYDNNYGCDYGYGYDCGYGCGYDCGYGCDCGCGCHEETSGRMTGGGSVFVNYDGTGYQEVEVHGHKNGRVTHGFEIHCGRFLPPEPNNLEINWAGHRFHLSTLSSGICIDSNLQEKPPVAGFDTFIGSGRGLLDGEISAKIRFTFTDAGEPGTYDTMKVRIFTPTFYGWSAIDWLNFEATELTFGNHQAHKYNK